MMRLRIGEVNREGSPAAYANGAFMLVRRSMYEALGGHARVREQLNDDIALAHLAKAEGYCLRIAGNADLVHTGMYGSARQARPPGRPEKRATLEVRESCAIRALKRGENESPLSKKRRASTY